MTYLTLYFTKYFDVFYNNTEGVYVLLCMNLNINKEMITHCLCALLSERGPWESVLTKHISRLVVIMKSADLNVYINH